MHLGTLLLSVLQRIYHHGQALRYMELRAMRGVRTHLRKRISHNPRFWMTSGLPTILPESV